MEKVIALVLYTCGILTLIEGFSMFKQGRNVGRQYVLYGLTAFFSSIWSIGFGLICIQNSYEIARLCRSIGMLGVFLFFFTLTELFSQWIEGAPLFKTYVRIFSGAGILLWPFIIGENSVTFNYTWLGMSYQFTPNIYNTLYNMYCVIVGVNSFCILVYILKRTKRKKLQVIMRNLIICCIVVMVGMIFDTLLPMFGFDALPTSTLSQSIGVMMMAKVLKFQKRSEITVENFSEFVYYSVDTPVLIYDEFGCFRLSNNGAADFFYDRKNMIFGQKIWDTFQIGTNSLEFKGSKNTIEAECNINNRFCQIEISKIFDEYQEIIGFIVVLNDLTEKNDFIKKLQESEKRAEAANRAKSNFLARMSHEIRTPINGIIGINEMILNKSKENNIIEYAEMVKRSSHNLVELVNDILDISKIETNHMVLENSAYRFDKLLQELFSMFSVQAQEKGLNFNVYIENPISVSMNGDERKIRQIAMNIIGNAIKYTKQGNVSVIVGSFDKNDRTYIRIAVKDTGIGIKQENINKIFDAFERLDLPLNKGIEGTGLGLFIVKSLVDIMKGTIEVKSEYGKGSEFILFIPQRPVGDESFESLFDMEDEGANSASNKLSICIPDKNILVVDDNEINRIVASELFSYTQATIKTAASGKECLELVREYKYDIIMLDHLMPEMDGIDVLKALKQMPDNKSKNAVCIVLTANAIQGAKEEYLSYGFDDYLSKPIDMLEVEKVLKKYC